MNYDEAMNMERVEFGSMPPQAFLLGLLSAFDNRYQATADAFFSGDYLETVFRHHLHQSLQGASDAE